MASEIRVNTINNRSGLGTVSITDTGLVVSGIITATTLDTSSTSTFSSDISIADKIIHTGDTNTAIRFPANDTFAVETGGSERLRITSTGNVGIGTNSPSSIAHIRQSLANAQLTLDSAAGFGFNIRAINNTSNNTLGLYGTRSAGTGSSGIDVVIGSTNTRSSGRAIMQVQNNGTSLLRVDAGGDVQISNGNLVFSTSGTGIDFSAASGSAAGSTSALLDDYEEGTWTPSVTFGGGSTGITGIFQGSYTKVGNTVIIRFVLSFTSKGSSTGDMVVSGMPFNVGYSDSTMSGFGYLHRIASPQTDGQIFLRTSGTTFFPSFVGYSGNNTARFTDADIANTSDLRGEIVYIP